MIADSGCTLEVRSKPDAENSRSIIGAMAFVAEAPVPLAVIGGDKVIARF